MAKQQTNSGNISGRVLEVGSPERISDKFSKRVLVMEIFSGKYANEVPFEFTNESMNQIKDVRPGDWVTVNYQLKARKQDREGQPIRRYVTLDGISCYRE
ncbi:MAG: DUF3127 domain-containing protein [Bacteroidales bacterium]